MPKALELRCKKSFVVKPEAPYNFDATVFKPGHYPDPLSVYEKGKYWFAMRFGGEILGIKMKNLGTAWKPKVKVEIYSKSALSEGEAKKILGEVDYRFEFDRDISGFVRKFRKDRVLAPFLKKWRGMRGSCAQDLYGLLMIMIFLQNTVVRRTVQMTEAMLKKYGTAVRFDGKEVFVFWEPKEMAGVPEEELRKLKVGYRAKLFVRLSESFANENIDELELRELPAEEAKAEIMKLYGVGPETARGLIHEALHHYETFDHVAPWQGKIYSRLLFNRKSVPPDRIIRYVKSHWGEWAALAASYVWEDIFWRRKNGEKIEWLEREIRL